jgi:hypothetical protein
MIEQPPMLIIDDNQEGAPPNGIVGANGFVHSFDQKLANSNVMVRMLVVCGEERPGAVLGIIAGLKETIRRQPISMAKFDESIDAGIELVLVHEEEVESERRAPVMIEERRLNFVIPQNFVNGVKGTDKVGRKIETAP